MSLELLAGVGVSDVTPPPGTPQGGWGAQIHQRSKGNDLPLKAQALVLASGGERLAIVDVDAIGFDEPMTARILDAISRLTGLSHQRIRFSCTHTHSGPNTFRLPMIREGLDMALSYLDLLPGQIAGAVWQAMNRLQPVRVGAALGESDINVNRRCLGPGGKTFIGCNPEAPADRTVSVLRFDAAGGALDGTPIACVLHYACHPTTMGWQNEFVTPDYPGQAKKVVEESLGAPCLFLQGATGDLGPRRGFTGDLQVYRRLGTILGLEGAKLAWNIDTKPTRLELRTIQESGASIGIYDEVPLETPPPVLRMQSGTVDLPLRQQPDPSKARANAAALRARLADVGKTGSSQELRDATAAATQAGMAADRAELYFGKTSMPWPIQVIRIGDIALVATAGEPFSQIGVSIRQRSPFPYTLVSGYTNGGFGYIPAREAFPFGGYEVETTPFSEDAAGVLIEFAVKMLTALHK